RSRRSHTRDRVHPSGYVHLARKAIAFCPQSPADQDHYKSLMSPQQGTDETASQPKEVIRRNHDLPSTKHASRPASTCVVGEGARGASTTRWADDRGLHGWLGRTCAGVAPPQRLDWPSDGHRLRC